MRSSSEGSVWGSAGTEPSTSSSQEEGQNAVFFGPFDLSPGTWMHPPTLWTSSSCSYNRRVPQHSQEEKHLSLREGPSWRRAPTAGEVEAFIERFMCSAWSPTWSPKGLALEVTVRPCGGLTAGQGGPWANCLPVGAMAGSFLRWRQVGRGSAGWGGTCCGG